MQFYVIHFMLVDSSASECHMNYCVFMSPVLWLSRILWYGGQLRKV